MQLEPYHPGRLTQSRRNAGLVAAGVTALGALAVGAVALGNALARLARPRAPEGAETALHRVDQGEEPAARHVQTITTHAWRRIDAIATTGLGRASVSVWMAEEWISREGE
jgi:hypothetical protein